VDLAIHTQGPRREFGRFAAADGIDASRILEPDAFPVKHACAVQPIQLRNEDIATSYRLAINKLAATVGAGEAG
jgi:hypothetical protein